MKLNILFIRSMCLLAVLLLLSAFTSTGFAANISKLQEKAAEKGRVRVIVGLQLPAPFIPEGAHASDKARELAGRLRNAAMAPPMRI